MTEIYTVRKGNTLWGIAREYNTTVKKLLELNPNLKSNPEYIQIGWKINVPPKTAEDVDMNVKGLSVERTHSKAKSQERTERKPNTGGAQGSVNPTANKVKGPTPNLLSTVDNKKKTLPPAQKDNASADFDTQVVEYIIGKYNPNPVFGKAELAQKIINTANAVDIDAADLAAIVKRESTFCSNEEIYRRYHKKGGPAGITKSPPNNMYKEGWTEKYDDRIAALIKQYGSLKNVFNAKNNNPEINLGEFGEMLYEYGSASNLKEACKEDYDLNLKVGAYYYKLMLKLTHGNKRAAFNRYNGGGTAGYGADAVNIVNSAHKRFS